MRKVLGVGLVLLFLIGTLSPVGMAELGRYNSLAAFITYEYGDYEIGSEVNVTVHVFKAGQYFDPDGVDLERRESGRYVDLIRSSKGIYQGSFEIEWEDLSDDLYISLDANIGMTSDYSIRDTTFVDTVYSRFQVWLIWLTPSEGDLRPGQVVSMEAQSTFQGKFVDPDPGSLIIRFYDIEDPGDPPDLDTTRVDTGRYRASYTVPDDIAPSTTFEVGTSANLTINIPTAHGDEEHTVRTGGWRSYSMDPMDLWVNVNGISPEEILFDLYVRDIEGQPVVDANVSLDFSYSEEFWNQIPIGSDDGSTGENGSVHFSIDISNVTGDTASMWIEGNVTHDDMFQEIMEIMFLAESHETGLGGQTEFSMVIIEEEMSFENGSLWLKNQVMSYGDELSGTDVYTYTMTAYDILNHSALRTNDSGILEVEYDIPEEVEYGSFPASYPTTYYHSLLNGSYVSMEETHFTFGTVDHEEYSMPSDLAQTVLQVGSAAPGDNLSIEFSNTLADGVDEVGSVIWSIAKDPFTFHPTTPEWIRWNHAPSLPTGGYLECHWTGDSYTTNLTVPGFLPIGTEIAIVPGIIRLDEVRGTIGGPLEWVTVSEAVGRPQVSITEPADNETINGIITIRGEGSSDNVIESVQVQVDDLGWQTAEVTGDWSYELDTTDLGYGNFTIRVRAYDGVAYSELATIRVHVDNPPSVTVADPSLWADDEDVLLVAGQVEDDLLPTKVEVRIDDGEWVEERLISQGSSLPIVWTHSIDLTTLRRGEHTLEVRTFDGSQYSDPVKVTFTVEEDGPSPSPTGMNWWSVLIVIAIVLVTIVVVRSRSQRSS